ncbi:MAG: tungsten formylmethanofuran dehydrogenase [Saprospiraceae bacterium]|nr:tungsten formylmethanofuran dehydrogenase [Saprospiraceae bacterium]
MSKNQLEARTALPTDVLLRGYCLVATAKTMAETYEENFRFVAKYVHAVSRGHEAVQVALGMQLLPQDILGPYYRDDAMMLSIGSSPLDLMLQLMAKRDDPYSGGRQYYCHTSLCDVDKPTIPHLSAATGMQAIPMTGAALGVAYKEAVGLTHETDEDKPIVVCSFGDASVTEGEVSEAFQMAVLKRLPILYLVQDNGWDISANAAETRAQDAAFYAQGFNGLEIRRVDGADFEACYRTFLEVIDTIRRERRPFLVHARVPLLTHHTSGVRKEWYRDDLEEHQTRDPFPRLRQLMLESGFTIEDLVEIDNEVKATVLKDFEKAKVAAEPTPDDLFTHIFAPTPITEECGNRTPSVKNPNSEAQSGIGKPTVMVDAALHAIEELMSKHKDCLFYGQDVGRRLGGVFREAATLAEKFGDERVFNTPIQEAFIIGSTVGMSAVGLKPIVEVQFADYIFPGINQLFSEVSRSCYLSNGKFPVSMILRVPIGAYGGGGPYHSSSVETIITAIRGLKIAYPSNGADLKGLLKAAYHDPNPCVILEHKGLYWSKVKGTEGAKNIEPDADYVLPFGKANTILEADSEQIAKGHSLVVVTYGMGVHWALNAAKNCDGRVEILDLRTLSPLDEKTIFDSVKKHGRCLVVTEEAANPSFAQSLAGRIQEQCFEWLDAPVRTIGAENVPAVPLNEVLERTMMPSIEKVGQAIKQLLEY